MSVASEIERIKTNIRNAYLKAEAKGAILPVKQDSNNLPATIESIVDSSNVATDIINGTITTVDQEALGQVESIRANAFDGLNIETVSVPSNVAVIGNSAFANNNITSLSLGDGVTTIGDGAFQNNSISTLTIPASVTTIGDGAFEGNVLTEITMESDVPPAVTETTFPNTLQATNVSYNGYANYVSDPNWQTYKDTLVRGLAIPSTITVIVNDYTGALVSEASVTISGNGQTYTGTTDSVGTFVQGDLQPATYTISVADMEGFKTPASSEVVVEEDTQNSVTVTYLEKPALEFSRTFSENTPAQISAVANEISANNMTSAEVESTYGWKIGDTTSYTLSTGENVEMRIIGFCHDDLSDGSGKAGITLEMTHCLATKYQMNSDSTNAGGYPASVLRNTTLPTIKATLPQEWQDIIVKVDKKSANGGLNYTETLTTSEDLFLLSQIEVITGHSSETADGLNEGEIYAYYEPLTSFTKQYDTNADGIPDTAIGWWLRSCPTTNDTWFRVVSKWGSANGSGTSASSFSGVSFAFCIGSAADYVPSTPEEPSGGSKVYGVEWVNDSSTTMTRTDDSVGMSYTIDTSTGKVASDFDNVFPYNQMKRQVIDGNTFVYVPEMWFRVVADAKKITSVAVSDRQGDGDNWYKTKPFYYGAYGASHTGGVLKSASGEAKYSSSRASMRSYAMASGTGYRQRDLYAGTILMFLWWIEFANKDSKSIMTGATSSQRTGNTDTIYNEEEGSNFCVSGYNTSTSQMVWHGIEDYVSSDYEWEDGITGSGSSGSAYYASDDYTLYDEYWNGSQMPALSFKAPTTSGFCLEALGWDVSKPFLCLPIATSSDSSYASGFCTFASKTPKETAYRGGTYGVSYFSYGSASHSSSITCGRLMKDV